MDWTEKQSPHPTTAVKRNTAKCITMQSRRCSWWFKCVGSCNWNSFGSLGTEFLPRSLCCVFCHSWFSILYQMENPTFSCLRRFTLVTFLSRCTMSSSCRRRKRASSTVWGTLSSVQSLWWPKGSQATPAGTASRSLLSTVGLIHCLRHRSVNQHRSADSWELRK